MRRGAVQNARLIARGTPESQRLTARVPIVLDLTSRLNALPFRDTERRASLLNEILGHPLPPGVTIYPPFYCDFGLNTSLGENVFVNQNCSFYDMGGITIGDRTMIGPGVTLSTAGHPVSPSERHDGLTLAPIVIGSDVWIGAAATITPGVAIGQGAVIGAGAVIVKDVPPMTLVTGGGQVERRRFS